MTVLPSPGTPYYGGGQVPNPANVLQLTSAPSSADVNHNVGTLAVNTALGNVYCLSRKPAGVATWTALGGGTLSIATLTGGSGGALSPTSGNFNLLGTANQITSTGSGSTITFSIPSAFTAPGSITATTSLTATNGNVIVSAGTTGLVLPVAAGSDAASGSVTCNGRVGVVTFTSVSVAANADITLTMLNSAITGVSTRCIYAMSGATTNSALTVKSYTPSAGQVVWVVTNGGGATSTANISFDFIVLN